ncbi:MAG: hypothetical protein R3352_01655 [Salinisphaeraceae bacterium]|nr:hypothetical protein [Salinisphaeraceae bacterium]
MHPFAQLDYDSLQALAQHRFARAGGTRPAVTLLQQGETRAVLKDYHVCSGWFRWLIAPLLVWREVRALKKLAGMRGIPQLVQQVDRLCFALEYLPAARLARKKKGEWPQPNWVSLDALIAEMHMRGLAHCDLRRSSNILFDEAGEPYLVDFVAHVQRGGDWNLPWNWAFKRFCRADRTAISKLKHRVQPEALTEEDQRLLAHSSWLDNAARGFGQSVRKLSQWMSGNSSR